MSSGDEDEVDEHRLMGSSRVPRKGELAAGCSIGWVSVTCVVSVGCWFVYAAVVVSAG